MVNGQPIDSSIESGEKSSEESSTTKEGNDIMEGILTSSEEENENVNDESTDTSSTSGIVSPNTITSLSPPDIDSTTSPVLIQLSEETTTEEVTTTQDQDLGLTELSSSSNSDYILQ